MSKQAIVLLSGGIDSTACVHYYLQNQFVVTSVYIDYGQAARREELDSAKSISLHYGVTLDIISADLRNNFGAGEISGRNAFLLFTVLLKYQQHNGLISLGIHSGTGYYDCSETFIKDMMNVVAGYSKGKIQIDAPFVNLDKGGVYQYALTNKLPIDLTYSCETGGVPCQKCNSCLDRRRLNVRTF
jgi:7-cyano-7-deazaguanine synthase